MTQLVKNLPAICETWVQSCVGKIPWRRESLPTPVFWPEETPWTEEPDRLQFMGLQRVGHFLSHFHFQAATGTFLHSPPNPSLIGPYIFHLLFQCSVSEGFSRETVYEGAEWSEGCRGDDGTFPYAKGMHR